MSEAKPKFIDQVAGAFAVSALVFTIGLLLTVQPWDTNKAFSFGNNPGAWFMNSLDFYAISVGIILVNIFAVAYPIERFWNKPTTKSYVAAAKYLLTYMLLCAVSVLAFGISPYSLAALLPYVFALGGIVAVISRLAYPFTKKYTIANRVVSIVVAVAALAGLSTPAITAGAAAGSGFFPATMTGEIARGTFEVDETNGSSGTQHTNGAFDPAKQTGDYSVYFACSDPANQKYEILIRSADYSAHYEDIKVTCDSPAVQEIRVDLGRFKTDVNVLVGPYADSENEFIGNENGKSSHSDAYAIIAPASN